MSKNVTIICFRTVEKILKRNNNWFPGKNKKWAGTDQKLHPNDTMTTYYNAQQWGGKQVVTSRGPKNYVAGHQARIFGGIKAKKCLGLRENLCNLHITFVYFSNLLVAQRTPSSIQPHPFHPLPHPHNHLYVDVIFNECYGRKEIHVRPWGPLS